MTSADLDLQIFWGTENAREIANYVWDDRNPALIEPWPTMEPAGIRDAIAMVLGHDDVTGYLYELRELETMLEADDV
jgi:hypothetical protein